MKRVHEGKKPFYLKKSAQKTLELVDKCVPVRPVCLRFRPALSRHGQIAGSRSFGIRASWVPSWKSAGKNWRRRTTSLFRFNDARDADLEWDLNRPAAISITETQLAVWC